MIVVGSYELHSEIENGVAITKEIAPIEAPDQRSGFYTKTFVVVGDGAANKAFGHLFNVSSSVLNATSTNYQPDYNPNLKARFQYWSDGMVLFDGFCRLDEVTIEDGAIKYHLNAFSGISNFFDELGEKKLSELDVSSFDHTYNRSNVEASWTHDYTDGYVYPMINYGELDGSKMSLWGTNHFHIAVFAKMLWDKIFNAHQWAYESTFLDTHHFEKLIIPSSSSDNQLPSSTISDWTFTVGSSSVFSVTKWRNVVGSTPNSGSRFDFNSASGTILDNALKNTSTSEYNTSTFELAIDKDISQAFRLAFTAELEYTGSVISFVDRAVARVALLRRRGGQTIFLEMFDLESFTFSSTTVSGGQQSVATISVNTETGVHNFVNGDLVYIAFTDVHIYDNRLISSGTVRLGVDNEWQLNISAGSLYGSIIDPRVTVGQSNSVQRAIPDMTQKEFIMNFAKMFNLHFDLVGDKTLLIEPRDEGYFLDDVEDWESKLDTKSEHKIIPMGELNHKRYLFTYEDDEDVKGRQYLNATNEVYGEKEYRVDNDFQTSEKEIRPTFATTILSDSPPRRDLVLSDMRFMSDDGELEDAKAKPRILYYGGLVDCNEWGIADDTRRSRSAVNLYYQYPYAGHLDDPITPTYDYLYSFPRNIYYSRAYGSSDYPQYPNRNLFNLYYYRHMVELTNKDSRVFEGYFAISKKDWTQLSFRKKYWFKDAYWRLVSAMDYDTQGEKLTLCRFLKSAGLVNPTYDMYKLDTGYGETDDNGDTLPFIYKGKLKDDNSVTNGTDRGSGNIVNGSQGFTYGDANIVSGNVRGYFLMNASGNSVAADGVFLVNTDGRNVEQVDEAWVNNVNLDRYTELELEFPDMQNLNATPVEILPALEDNQFYDIQRATLHYESNGTPYNGAVTLEIRSSSTNIVFMNLVSTNLIQGTSTGATQFNEVARTATTYLCPLSEAVELRNASTELIQDGGVCTFRIYYRIMEI